MTNETLQDDNTFDDLEHGILSDGSAQYLTFLLNGEEYGVEILKVQGIQGWGKVTPIPNTPDFVLGVINMRGAIVPIVDLRKRFSLKDVSYDSTTVVIVVKVSDSSGERVVGLVVDAVSEVYSVTEKEVKPPPNFGATVSTDYIKGLSTIDDKMLILLEIDSLIGKGVLDLVPGELIQRKSA